MNFHEELALHIRARYPVIWLTSYEERRIERILTEICKEQGGKTLYVWSATKGFTKDGKDFLQTATALDEAFKTLVDDAKSGSKSIYLFRDLHKFLPASDQTTYRMIRDTAEVIKGLKTTIIIVSPILALPKELEKVVTVLDVPYPNAEELREVMERVIKSASKATEGTGIKIKSPENGDAEQILRSAAGLTEEEMENIVAKSLMMHQRIDPATVVMEKEGTIRKSGLVDFYQTVEGLNDVGGLENLKDWIIRRSKCLSKKAIEYGLRPPKGVFLAGVTGCGKSLSVKAMANHMRIPLLMVDSSKVLGSYVGQSEQNLRAIFKLARAVSPCIVMIDEAEKMLPQGSQGDSGVSSRIFGMLLTEMQETPASTPVIFAMTANDPMKLPPELFTRFDATFFLDLPSISEREQVWAVQIRKIKREPKKFDIKKLAEKSEGWTGREMEMICNEALARAFDDDKEVTTEYILKVLAERVPISVQRKPDIEKMRMWGKDTAIPASGARVVVNTDERKMEW